jgi:hypothetical protein
VSSWARPLIESSLKVDGGDAFLVTTAALEFMRGRDSVSAPMRESEPEAEQEDGDENRDEDGMDDLNEAGAEWLAEQGFDPLDR